MTPSSSDLVLQVRTQAALAAMQAYFTATAQSRPYRERQQLAREWLAAVRRLRVTTQ